MTYSGGYYHLRASLIKAGINRHTASLEDPVSDEMLNAVNTVQRTRWQIDPFIVQTMGEAYDAGLPLGGIPDPNSVITVDDLLPDHVWDAMSHEEQRAFRAKRAVQWEEENSLQGKRRAFARQISLARELRNREAIWFPHALDFRGRVYPLPQDLHPQGDQICKALLRFADGKPLGDRGMWWLMVALANAAGQDKMPFEDRVKWVKTNSELIVESVENPLDGERFWLKADDPWHFLALAKDYAGALREGPGFLSQVPVHIDATCSGMQHLSAMGLDPIGARATNLLNTGKREDLYSEVAEVVKRLVSQALSEGDPIAEQWLGKISRSTVKRAVMTTPYGVTEVGIRDQLVADGHTKGLEGNPSKNAGWLKDRIVKALEETVVSAKQIMGWLQDVANVLAHEGYAFEWTTGAGMKVRQAYLETKDTRVVTLYGNIKLQTEIENGEISKRKAALAAAPNYVHSQDAAHLALTVNAARERGIKSFALIHDSYGTHGSDVELLSYVLREQFVKMYSVDRLALLEEEVSRYAPGVELPARPPRGNLDISQVMDSPYFFS